MSATLPSDLVILGALALSARQKEIERRSHSTSRSDTRMFSERHPIDL